MNNISVREAHASQTAGSTYVDVPSVPEFAEEDASAGKSFEVLLASARRGK